jgi:hypothetical protein
MNPITLLHITSAMKRLHPLFLVVVGLLFFAVSLRAQEVIYAATGSNGTAGTLYTIGVDESDPSTFEQILASVEIRVQSTGAAIGLTGIAFNPMTDTLYGVTVNSTAAGNTLARTLVTIDPLTGLATVIGSLGSNPIADITFAPDGTLYGFQAQNPFSLVRINLATAATSLVGNSGLAFTVGGGLALSPSGTLYLSGTGADGTLDTLNPTTGARTVGPSLTDAPYVQPGALSAMTFSASGTLYASNTNQSGPPVGPFADVELVTINVATGAVTDLFPLPENTDAIAWRFAPVPEASTTAMFALGGACCVALAAYRRRATRR